MGCFDTIWTNCPTCGARIEWQTKPPIDAMQMQTWPVQSAPLEVARRGMWDIELCECGTGVMLAENVHGEPVLRVSFDVPRMGKEGEL